MILRFLHGWGFDAGFWTRLVEELSEWRVECDDRGYFGRPSVPEAEGPCIVVTHSFGAMRALSSPPVRCRGLVAINGFDRFVPGVSPRIVDRMIAKFGKDPRQVLSDFRRRCGNDDERDDERFGHLDTQRLRQDLLALRDNDGTVQSAAWATPVLSLQGGLDPLLSPAMREEAFAAAPLIDRVTCPGGGHLLPVTDAPYCARVIRNFAERAV